MRPNLIPSRVAIRNERLRRGLTVHEVAAAVGITPAALHRIEKGTRNPHIKTVRKLATVYDVSVEELLDEVPAVEAATATPAAAREGAA